MDNLINETKERFQKEFGQAGTLCVVSPARINLLGEHIDYNDGFVMPAAITKAMCFVAAPSKARDSQFIEIVACDIDQDNALRIDLKTDISPDPKTQWKNYLLGVLSQLQNTNTDNTNNETKSNSNTKKLGGFQVMFASDIPMGAGLSSSAALSCGFCLVANTLFDLQLSQLEIAQIGQKAEHTFVGTQCGIMDQFANVFGRKNCVLHLDCQTLQVSYHTADFCDYSILLLDSCVPHSLHTSEYNARRQECSEGLKIVKQFYSSVASFRDVSEEMVQDHQQDFPPSVFARVLFVVQEIERVEKACRALDSSDFDALGSLMYQTHWGLSKLYQVSCPELDFLVQFVTSRSEVAGARLMGGGFGGCTINLVKRGSEEKLIQEISQVYQKKFGIQLKAYQADISDGLRVLGE